MMQWHRDALAAGFDLDALTSVAELVARGGVAVDGTPVEELPGYWVVPGFVPYDGHTILATVDRRRIQDRADTAHELALILDHAVAEEFARIPRMSEPPTRVRTATTPNAG
jgi:hypothetical protein